MQPPNEPTGSHPIIPWLRKLLRFCVSSRLLPGNGYFLKETTGGTILEIRPGNGGGGSAAADTTIQQVKIVSMGGGAGLLNTFTAHTWDGTNEGTDLITCARGVKARPLANLSETIDGATITYTYTNSNLRTARDATNQTQLEVLYPRYNTGDVIFIVKPANGTGVAGAQWLDITARVWARRFLQ